MINRIEYIVFGFLGLVLFVFGFFNPCLAKDITLTPSISTVTGYDDNLDFDSGNKLDDWWGQVIPRIALDYASERLRLGALAEVDYKKYLDETEFDRLNQFYRLDGEYQLSERFSLLGDFSFRRDETTDTQLQETGRAFTRDKRYRYNAGGGVRYQITELQELSPTYRYEKVDFGDNDEDNEDFDSHAIGFNYQKKFKNQTDIINLEPTFTRWESNIQQADNYNGLLSWTHLFSDIYEFRASAGARYTDAEEKGGGRQEDTSWGPIGGASISAKTELISFFFGYDRFFIFDSDGEGIVVDRVSSTLNALATERFGLRCRGSFIYSENDFGNDDPTVFWEATPSVYYNITENHYIELAYSYTDLLEIDEDPNNDRTTRNTVFLSLNLSFPQSLD